MKIIAGLGNPGPGYAMTRHNIGFMVVNALAQQWGVSREQSRFDAIIGETRCGSEKVLLVKPLTFMNLSGKAIQPLLSWYKTAPEDFLIIYDDMALPLGTLRFRAHGSAGGHKGMSSVITRLGTQEIPRLRIGIGKDAEIDTVGWVLGRFAETEKVILEKTIKTAAEAVDYWCRQGLTAAMNNYNNVRPSSKKKE